ncbi:MAG: trypsin-like peptidase domain-containing protein [Bacteroidota bacterium]
MRSKFALAVVLITISLIIGLAIGYGVGSAGVQPVALVEQDTAPFEWVQTAERDPDRDSTQKEITVSRHNAITRAVSRTSSAVVGVNVTEIREYRDPFSSFWDDPFFRQFFGDSFFGRRSYKQEVKGLGSGFLISPDGYVVTNDHVAGSAVKITLTLTSGEKYEAQLIGSDPVSDVALLKIDGNNLPYLKFGDSDDVIIGEWVIALGNPFGLFEINDKPTVTVGVVSSTGLNLTAGENRVYRDMIQTDAAINRGNSGGPLLNSLGKVIGVNTIIYSPNQGSVGVGFAIPINRVKVILNELKTAGKVDRNFWTGFAYQPVDVRVASYFGLDQAVGVIVTEVAKNSPAEKAGLKPGDIILEANGQRILNETGFRAFLVDLRAGDRIKLKVYREKKTFTTDLTVERRSA